MVTNESGAPVPLKRAGVAAVERNRIDSAGLAILDVRKGYPREAALNLSELYDLSAPGKYTVVVRVYVFQRGHRDTVIPVTSRPLQFNVPRE